MSTAPFSRNHEQAALARLEALRALIPSLRQSRGTDWEELRQELQAIIAAAKRCRSEDEWRELGRRIERLATRHQFRSDLGDEVEKQAGPDRNDDERRLRGVTTLETLQPPRTYQTRSWPARSGPNRSGPTLAARLGALLTQLGLLLQRGESGPLVTWPRVTMPDEVVEKTPFEVRVQLRRRDDGPPTDRLELSRDGRRELAITVELLLPPGDVITARGGLQASLVLEDGESSAVVVFELEARRPGKHRIEVMFRDGDEERLVVRPAVVVQPVGSQAADAGAGQVLDSPLYPSPPDAPPSLVLNVLDRGVTDGGHRIFRVTLRVPDRAPIAGAVDPREEQVDLWTEIGHRMGSLFRTDRAPAREHHLRSIGVYLAEQLLPKSIRDALDGED